MSEANTPAAAPQPTRLEAIGVLTAVGQPYELVEQDILGRRQRAFRNAPANLREMYEAARSEATFLVYGDERVTFEAFWSASEALASRLIQEFGVRRGDRVAISMRNYPEWMVAFAAATSAGAIAVALNALWQPEELAFALTDCDPKVLFVDQERLERLSASGSTPTACRVIATRTTKPLPENVLSWAAATAEPAGGGPPLPRIDPDDDAIMLYTSGSVGWPKGVLSTHRAVLSALLSWELEGAIGVAMGALEPPKPGAEQAVTLLGIPLFHVTGLHAVFLSSFRGQRRIVSMYKWDPAVAADLIETERVSSLVAPSAVTGDLVAYARETGRDLSSLAVVGGGGAARAPSRCAP